MTTLYAAALAIYITGSIVLLAYIISAAVGNSK